jgi:hypothetical protein
MTLSPTGDLPPTANAHVRIEDGYLRPSTELPPLEQLHIISDFSWLPREAPTANSDMDALWQTLEVRAEVSANLLGEAWTGAARLTRTGDLEAGLTAKNVAIDERFLIEAGLEPSAPIRQTWSALGLAGRANVSLGLRMPLTGEFDPKQDLDIALDIESDRQGKFCFNGWDYDGDGPYERKGIPLACDLVSGHVVFGHRGANQRGELLGIFDASGSHGTGMARAAGIIASPLEERMGSDLDLIIEVDDRELNPELENAFAYMESLAALHPRASTCVIGPKREASPHRAPSTWRMPPCAGKDFPSMHWWSLSKWTCAGATIRASAKTAGSTAISGFTSWLRARLRR